MFYVLLENQTNSHVSAEAVGEQNQGLIPNAPHRIETG